MQTTLLRSAKHLVWLGGQFAQCPAVQPVGLVDFWFSGGGGAVRVPQICLTQNLICFVSKKPIPNFTTLELPLLEEK